jgi:hypothetical protein
MRPQGYEIIRTWAFYTLFRALLMTGKRPWKDIVIHARLRGFDLTFHTTWGLFSPERIDEGTQMLIDSVEARETDSILDLGCDSFSKIGIIDAFYRRFERQPT